MIAALQALDWEVLRWIQSTFRCGALDFLMPNISMLGDVGAIWLVIALVLIFSKKHRKCGITLLIALALCFLIGNLCLKPLVARPRPCWLDPGVTLLIPNETDFSFPSGHTLASFAAATVLLKWDRRYGICAFVLAFLIAFSRLYLYVHFPSDILGGMAIGVLIGLLASAAGKWLFDHLEPHPPALV